MKPEDWSAFPTGNPGEVAIQVHNSPDGLTGYQYSVGGGEYVSLPPVDRHVIAGLPNLRPARISLRAVNAKHFSASTEKAVMPVPKIKPPA